MEISRLRLRTRLAGLSALGLAAFILSPEPGSKRYFRGLTFIFSPRNRRFCLTYMAFWDPVTGTWNVLG